MQISGHINVQSINNYSSLNSRQLQTISTIISTESQSRERSAQPMSHSELPAICGLSSIFANSIISGNIEMNINNHASRKPPVKKKRLVIEFSDSSQICRNILRDRTIRLTFPSFLYVLTFMQLSCTSTWWLDFFKHVICNKQDSLVRDMVLKTRE